MAGWGRQNVGTKENPIWVQEGASATDIANAKNMAREQEIRGMFEDIVGMYSPGGSFGSGYKAELERTKTRDLAKGTQSLISSGLYGSTMAAGLGTAWEESVGAPARLKLEDVRTQRYAEALGQKAGFIERIEDQSPSFELMAGLEQQAASAPGASLSQWLGQEFGGVPNAATPKADASLAGQRAETSEWQKKQAANYAQLLERYGSSGSGGSTKPYLSTEEDRDTRKKAGTYLGSDGKVHRV